MYLLGVKIESAGEWRRHRENIKGTGKQRQSRQIDVCIMSTPVRM
jgi:hypothetical protein